MTTLMQDRGARRELPKPLIYRERDLKALTSLSRKAREDAMNAGTFPRPVPLGPKARGWLVSEIEAWIEQRKAIRDGRLESGVA